MRERERKRGRRREGERERERKRGRKREGERAGDRDKDREIGKYEIGEKKIV